MRNFSHVLTSKLPIEMKLLPIIFLAIAGLGCHRNAVAPPQVRKNIQLDYDSERAAIVSAVIREMYVNDGTRLLVIEHEDPCALAEPKETPEPEVAQMPHQMEDHAFQNLPDLADETIDDFHARFKECHHLANKLDVPVKYVLIGSKDLEPLFPEGSVDRGWNRFYVKYTNSSGVIQFSNPGFNRDYTQSIVSTGRWCGGNCGSGYFLLLTKDGGVWKVKTKVGTWVS